MVDWKSKPPHLCKNNPKLRLQYCIGLFLQAWDRFGFLIQNFWSHPTSERISPYWVLAGASLVLENYSICSHCFEVTKLSRANSWMVHRAVGTGGLRGKSLQIFGRNLSISFFLQSYLLTGQFSLSGQLFLHWAAVNLKGLVEFQNKKIRPLFTIIFNSKMLVSRSEILV